MLVIPMWLDISCTKKGRDKDDESALVSFRYSPRSKTWWWHNWERDECGRAFDVCPIHKPSDILIAEQQIVKIYDGLELENDYHIMDYVWCRWDKAKTRCIWNGYQPDREPTRLPWDIPVTDLDARNNGDTAVFLYGDRYSSCVVDIYNIHPESFKLFGIVMEPRLLAWRHATGSPCGKTAEGKPIYYIKVTQWVFHDERELPISNPILYSYPVQTTFRRELREDEVLKEDMTDDEKNHTALSLLLRPDPVSRPLR